MSTKIEDGFDTSSAGVSSMRSTAPRSALTPAMTLAIIAIVLFAGGLGFVGGMQVGKSSPNNTMSAGPGGNSPMMPQQTTNSNAAGGASTQQGPPSSTGNSQQPVPQTGGSASGNSTGASG